MPGLELDGHPEGDQRHQHEQRQDQPSYRDDLKNGRIVFEQFKRYAAKA